MPKLIRLVLALVLALLAPDAAHAEFVLVIDPGHGGHDAGAVGAFSKEKDINLRVALAFGRLVEQNCPDVKVVYTRSRDMFIPLDERANIANRNKADLFISIHTNSLPKGRLAYGAETYTLGTARAGENLEVAKRENAVITFESNYQQKYEGFDPNKAESYIIFEFIQDTYMKQSVDLARQIQQQYVSHAGRKNKGVHQAGFLVLRKTSMPAVLTELGFISTPEEERYLNSEEGTRALSRSIYHGFLGYRRLQGAKTPTAALVEESPKKENAVGNKPAVAENKPTATENKPAVAENKPAVVENKPAVAENKPTIAESKPAASDETPVFKVQIGTSATLLKAGDARFYGLAPVDYYEDGGLYKYTYGATTDYREAVALQREASAKIKDAFVVAFIGGRRVNLAEARSKQR